MVVGLKNSHDAKRIRFGIECAISTGEVDEQALTNLEVINPDLVQRWEALVRSLPEIEQVAVVAQAQVETQPRLHLQQLLGDWKATAAIATEELTPSPVIVEKHPDDSAHIPHILKRNRRNRIGRRSE